MTEHSLAPGGEHGRHPPATGCQDRVAHRIRPAMYSVKPAPTSTLVDRVVAQAEITQLRARHDTVLPPRELRDDAVERG